MPQSVVDSRLALPRGVMQDPQILASRSLFDTLGPQSVIGEPKSTRPEHVLAIAVVLERPRLADQLIDDVTVVHGVLVTSHKPR